MSLLHRDGMTTNIAATQLVGIERTVSDKTNMRSVYRELSSCILYQYVLVRILVDAS